jgi:hypothetical protein
VKRRDPLLLLKLKESAYYRLNIAVKAEITVY